MLITWDDIFKFDDQTPLNNATAAIERLEQTIVKFVDTAANKIGQYAQETQVLKDEAQKLIAVTNSLSSASGNYEEQLVENAKVSDNLMGRQQTLNKLMHESKEETEALEKQLDSLRKAKEKLRKETDAEEGSLDDLRAKLVQAEKDYKALGNSADASTKQAHLQRVRDLAARHGALNKELATAKKSADVAAGSYNELSKRVAAGALRLREMSGGMQANSKEFRELRKYVAEGTEKLKDWDSAIGQNTRRVGGYADEIGRLVPALGGVTQGLQTATSASRAFLASPIGIFIGGIAIAIGAMVASVREYYTGSIEGQEELNLMTAKWDGLLATVKSTMRDIGGEIVKMISGESGWGKALEIIKMMGNPLAFAMKVSEFLAKKSVEVAQNQELALKWRALENKIAAENAKDIIEDSQTELEISRLLELSKDKIGKTDQERFAAWRQARGLIIEMARGDVELAELRLQHVRDEIKLFGETIERREAEARAIAEVNAVETRLFERKKELHKQEIQFVNDANAAYQAQQKMRAEAFRVTESLILSDAIAANDRIIADVRSTGADIARALSENADLRIDLMRLEQKAATDAAKEEALKRIELSAEESDRIYGDRSLTLEQMVALEREVKEKRLATDEDYLKAVANINLTYAQKVEGVNNKLEDDLEKNVFTQLEEDARKLLGTVEKEVADAATVMNAAFAGGAKSVNVGGVTYDISSIKKFNEARRQLEVEGERQSYLVLLDSLKKKLQEYEMYGHDVTAILTKISDTEKALSEITVDEMIIDREKWKQAMTDTARFAYDSILESIDQFNANAQARRDDEMRGIEERQEREMMLFQQRMDYELAGLEDNTKKKAEVEQAFVAERAEIENRYERERRAIEAQNKIARQRAARFEKAIAMFEAGINIATAITKVIAFPPLAIAIAALGAVQLAAIATAPLPAYKKGVESSPEGWAVVHAGEIVEPRHADPYYVKGKKDAPVLAYLERNTKVHTAQEVDRMKAEARFDDFNMVMDKGSDAIERYLVDRNERAIVSAIDRNFGKLDDTIRQKESANIAVTILRGEFDYDFMREQYK